MTEDQAEAVEDILSALLRDLRGGDGSSIVIQGEPGTGKTVVAIYLLKLLSDIADAIPPDGQDTGSRFAHFYSEDARNLLAGTRVGIVVPQQSLRKSIKKVFRRTPGLNPDMVLTPFDVGFSGDHFDLLIVDEAHRLNQRANQASGVQNRNFREITERLFGWDDKTKTQLDWIRAKSRNQIFLLDVEQTIRPADIPSNELADLVSQARGHSRHFALRTQMRVVAGSDYVGYIRSMLRGAGRTTAPQRFDGYDLRLFDDLGDMRHELHLREAEVGLSRLVAGFAWEWKSKNDRGALDIEVQGHRFRWNSTQVDWIASPSSLSEVGSIHTVQGYDLNFAAVIIGPDLRYDPVEEKLFVDRNSYFDVKGKENNPTLGKSYTDDDLLRYISNVYAVLLTRGMLGTYVYVCDPALREYLRPFLSCKVRESDSAS